MQFRFTTPQDATILSEYYLHNFAHLQRWEPTRPAGFHSPTAWFERLVLRELEQQERGCVFFGVR